MVQSTGKILCLDAKRWFAGRQESWNCVACVHTAQSQVCVGLYTYNMLSLGLMSLCPKPLIKTELFVLYPGWAVMYTSSLWGFLPKSAWI